MLLRRCPSDLVASLMGHKYMEHQEKSICCRSLGTKAVCPGFPLCSLLCSRMKMGVRT